MRGSMLRILLPVYAFGFAKAFPPLEFLQPPLNYNGAKRSLCPLGAHQLHQPADREDTSVKLKQLRSAMTRVSAVDGPPLDGYIVTSGDEHQNESPHPEDMRRQYITGFHGSAGEALVTIDKAVFWTDARYHIQADQQLDCNWILMKQGREGIPTITEWLKHEFRGRGSVRIGADPEIVSAADWKEWEDQLEDSTVRLVPVRSNLVDYIWLVNRPYQNLHPAYPLPDEYAGKPWQEKIQNVRFEMEISKADALILTAFDEIAWLFNIRGYDLPNTPVLRAYAIITHGSAHLFARREKIVQTVKTHLKMDSCFHADCVKFHEYADVWQEIRTMSQAWNTVWLPTRCGYTNGVSMKMYTTIPSGKRLLKPSPILNLRAQKNKIEAEGMRTSHLRDAVAMCDFLAYMEEQFQLNSNGWDEMQVARLANEFRYEQDNNKGISFPTIAGYGPHGAVPHYEPNNRTNIKIGNTSTLVVDSGGQYLDGTTDVTRTLHFGEPTEEQKKAYTRVLIGSIQLSSLIFPDTMRSDQLDAFARAPLWNIGYDYLHGTGHGIGHFLTVHESPISVSYMQAGVPNEECGTVRLKPGFFLSNEPGYYKEDDFGVRLENILEVVNTGKSRGAEKFLTFRDVTLVPYEPKLINIDMLNPSHRRWLNNYNRRIREEVGTELKNRLKMNAFYWMMEKTASIPELSSSDEGPFLGHSNAMPSTFKQFHVLVFIVFLYHVTRNLPSIRK